MKKTGVVLSFMLGSLLASPSIAQVEMGVKMGPEFKSRKETVQDVIGEDESGIYVLSVKSGGMFSSTDFILKKYDKGFKMISESELELEYKDNDLEFEFIEWLDDKIYLFSSYNNSKKDQSYLFYQSINKNTLKPNSDIKKITEMDMDKKGLMRRLNTGDFLSERSADSSKYAVLAMLPYEKKEAERFNINVYDNKMNLLWDKQITLPYTDDLYEVKSHELDNNGNFYIVGKKYKDKAKDKRKGEVNFTYEVLAYKNQGQEIKKYEIKTEKFITDLTASVLPNGNLIAAGFYSEEGTTSIIGTFYLSVDASSGKVLSKNFKEFSTEFLTKYMSERSAEKTKKRKEKGKDVELYQYDLKELIRKDDGGAYLVAEQFYISMRTTSHMDANGNWTTRTDTEYNYEDIIVVNISPEGEIQWAEKIPKYQSTINDGGYFSSYSSMVYKDKLFLIFNDHEKNLETWKEGKIRNFTGGKKGVVTLVQISPDGKQVRTPLFDHKFAEVITRPKVCEQVSPNRFVIYGEKRKHKRFATMNAK